MCDNSNTAMYDVYPASRRKEEDGRLVVARRLRLLDRDWETPSGSTVLHCLALYQQYGGHGTGGIGIAAKYKQMAALGPY